MECGGRMTVQYDNNYMSHRTVNKSMKRFSGGWANAVDKYCGCSLTVTHAKIKKHQLSGTTKGPALMKLPQK
jgi:hypothetical protein